MARVILVEASPWNATTGVAATVGLAGGGGKAYTHRSRNDWLAGVVSEPRFQSKIDFNQNGFSGGAKPQFGTLDFAAAAQATVNTLAAYLWIGAAIEVFTGDDELASPVWTTLIKGTVSAQSISNNMISFGIRDASGDLDDPLIFDRFTGAGGVQGDAAATNRIKRRTWGRAFNVEAQMLISANNILELGDPAFPLSSIDDVKDKGRSASSLVTVAWAGSAAATLTALIAANAPQGGGVIAPSIACVKWWTQPAGPLTADIKGEVGAGYVETVASMAARIAAVNSTLTISNVSAINTVRPDAAGIHVDSSSETSAQALDRLLKGVSIVWNITAAGVIDLAEIKLTSPVETVKVVEASRETSFKPIRTRLVGYKRNHRQHGDGEISAANLTTNWLQETAPTYAESMAGDRWIDTDDDRKEYQRTSGVLTIGGTIPTIGGSPIFIAWNQVSDRRIDYALENAADAQATADSAVSAAATAQSNADAALLELDNIASDGLLTPDEKPRVILDRDVIIAEQAGIDAQATAFGITTEKTAYDASITALVAYLATLTTPTLWSDISGNTTIVGATFRGAFAAVYVARQTLLNKIAAVAKARADLGVTNAATAQAAADLAQLGVNRIGDDNWLTSGEKTEIIIIHSALTENYSALLAKATALGVAATERTNATTAMTALNTYLATLSPAWNSVSGDSAIVGTTFRTKFSDAHNKVALLQAAVQGLPGADGTSAVDIYKRQYAPPSTPTGDNPSGWTSSPGSGTATLWKSSGTKNPAGNLIGAWSTPIELSQGEARGYASGDTYYIRNLVTYNGGTYVALQATSTGNAPSGDDQATAYFGVIAAPGSPGTPAVPPAGFSTTINLTSATGANLRSLANANGYTGLSNATITFNVPSAVVVRGAAGSGIGIDTGTWPTGSYSIALTIVVQSGGIVDGGGGNGGAGGGGAGGAGGDAFYIRTPISGGLTIDSGGTVRGGGGGGYGGNGAVDFDPMQLPQFGDPYQGGGGGGGGRPNGAGGAGEAGADGGNAGSSGSAGTTTTTGTGGLGGVGTYGSGGAGSNGGSFAVAADGAAGYAVRKNGNAVTVTNNGTMTGTAA